MAIILCWDLRTPLYNEEFANCGYVVDLCLLVTAEVLTSNVFTIAEQDVLFHFSSNFNYILFVCQHVRCTLIA